MFSLIITLIVILLVGALAAAAIYYGGNTDAARKKAVAERVFNEGAQIQAAAVVHRVNDGDYAPNIEALITSHHLSAKPQGGWRAYKDTAVLLNTTFDQCEAVNSSLGISGVPLCTDPAIQGKEVCCKDVQ